MIIREVEQPHLTGLIKTTKILKPVVSDDIDHILSDVQLVGSGKGALAIILRHLAELGILENKLSEVLVADWIGYWVYNQIQNFAFPAKILSKRTKAILVYHQYGFPQDMDKIMEYASENKLIVIEDCAHAMASFYRGRAVGSFGDYAIYSFSKWVFCLALGGVKAKEKVFYDYSNKLMSSTPLGLTLFKDIAKYLSEKSLSSNGSLFKKYASILLQMSYALYGEALKPSAMAKRLLYSKIYNEIRTRRQRYRYFREKTAIAGICDHLEPKDVVPYVIPVFCPDRQAMGLVDSFKHIGVNTGVYHFDINRNMLNPKFVRHVWLPCHGGIPDRIYETMVDLVLKVI